MWWGRPSSSRDEYGFTGQQFALAFALNGAALVLSAQLNAALVRKVPPVRLLRMAVLVQLGLALVLLAAVATGAGGAFGLMAGLWLVLGVQGMVPANASVLALHNYGHMAGTAAAVIGALQSGVAGLVSPLVGLLGGNALSMVGVMIGSCVLTVIVLAAGTPAYRRGGWPDHADRGDDERVTAGD
jgi:MFS transporter, DHA1 family, multidrug resistance protein